MGSVLQFCETDCGLEAHETKEVIKANISNRANIESPELFDHSRANRSF
jgi:hypothetical protein